MDAAELDRLLDPAAMTEPGLGRRVGRRLTARARRPGRRRRPAATIRPMTETRLWDRAAALPARTDGVRLPEVATLAAELPTVAELFDFMRDAELRFATLRLRIEERARTSRGEELTLMDAVLRHPGDAKVTTTRPNGSARAEYEVWISDGDLVRTYCQRPSPRHPAADPQPAARARRPRLPGHGQGLRAGDRAPDRDAARDVRPSRRLLPERARDRTLRGHRHRRRHRPRGRPARVRPSAHDRAARRPAGLPHLDRGRSRYRGHPATRRIDRRRRHPRRRGGRAVARRAAAAGRVRTSSSPPGRRCSTELGPDA